MNTSKPLFLPLPTLLPLTPTLPLTLTPVIDHELWFAEKMGKSICIKRQFAEIFDGDTTVAMRRERVRWLILSHGLATRPCGSRSGRQSTFAEVFQFLYGEAL